MLGEIIDLYGRLGDRPFNWYAAANTTEAVLRNSYTHPRLHLSEYLKENGLLDRAAALWVDAEADLQTAGAPARFVALVRYNLACIRVPQGELDDAIKLLADALPANDVLKAAAPNDKDLEPLRDDPRFQELIKT